MEQQFCKDTWFAWVHYPRDLMAWMQRMLGAWYSGDPTIMGDLFAGTIRPLKTQLENLALAEMARMISGSEELRGLFEQHADAAFFERCRDSEDGRAFLERYERFREEEGFRGHEDRDMIFPRRCQDPSIDYRAFRSLMSAGGPDEIEQREAEVNRRREAGP